MNKFKISNLDRRINFFNNKKNYQSTKQLRNQTLNTMPAKLKSVKSTAKITRKYIPIDIKEARKISANLLFSDKLNDFGSVKKQFRKEILGTEEDFKKGRLYNQRNPKRLFLY
jgi:hypothetical protein